MSTFVNHCARLGRWCIERNPMYLLSTACMAVGTRLYLVDPSSRAGDVGLILLTLGILQAYEWAVATILLLLYRRRRSPEDLPSLMLIAALFWTGPMAATSEMTAHRADLGLILAVAAFLVAMAEFGVVCRVMKLRFSLAGQLVAGACVLFLALVPPFLKVPASADGTNELFLYFSWWLLAGITLLTIKIVDQHAHGRRTGAWLGREWRGCLLELAFLVIVLAATTTHLSAMNYAFWGHAKWFYASPLIVAATVVLLESLARLRVRSHWLPVVGVVLPAAAIFLAREPFDEHVPVAWLPVFLRDPLLSTLVLAAAAWWWSAYRHRASILFHAGSAALVGVVWRANRLVCEAGITHHWLSEPTMWPRDLIVLSLYAMAGYLLLSAIIRRSRPEALMALVIQQAAVTMAVWDIYNVDLFLICISAGWSCLIGLHLLSARPRWTVAGWPIVFLLLISWIYDFNPYLNWIARSHVIALVMVLLLAGLARPWSHYRYLAIGAGVGNLAFYGGQAIVKGPHPIASMVVSGGFILLAAGATVSWYKPLLLHCVRRQGSALPAD